MNGKSEGKLDGKEFAGREKKKRGGRVEGGRGEMEGGATRGISTKNLNSRRENHDSDPYMHRVIRPTLPYCNTWRMNLIYKMVSGQWALSRGTLSV